MRKSYPFCPTLREAGGAGAGVYPPAVLDSPRHLTFCMLPYFLRQSSRENLTTKDKIPVSC
ncbi:MAG: hypothetical protein HXY43_19530 [Fischerella sp.]|uniref:hypothetical protein n=1 Tax=Fischerella sp. TaxID=1191 RepID=UPI00178FB69C|nr:hypothetical protein [Fischerella sp.]NWF61377.1 hypothetical protein [Fischerella sp.]